MVEKVPKFGYAGSRTPSKTTVPSWMGMRLIRGVGKRSGRKPALRWIATNPSEASLISRMSMARVWPGAAPSTYTGPVAGGVG